MLSGLFKRKNLKYALLALAIPVAAFAYDRSNYAKASITDPAGHELSAYKQNDPIRVDLKASDFFQQIKQVRSYIDGKSDGEWNPPEGRFVHYSIITSDSVVGEHNMTFVLTDGGGNQDTVSIDYKIRFGGSFREVKRPIRTYFSTNNLFDVLF